MVSGGHRHRLRFRARGDNRLAFAEIGTWLAESVESPESETQRLEVAWSTLRECLQL
jgi:hypothetical protein